MRRTVAVTGATGFIGSHIVRQLADAGYRVRVLARRLPVHPVYAERPVEAVFGSLGEAASLRALLAGADAVVHCAGLVKARSREQFFEVNAAGVRLVAEAARAQAAPVRFLLLSSLAAREPQLSDYAASKRAGETALTQAGGALAWTIIRPPAVYGPGDHETLTFFRAAQRSVVAVPGARSSRFSLIYASDLARSVHKTLESGATVGTTFEVDDGRSGGYSWEDLAAAAGAALGTRPNLIRIPRPALQAFAFFNEWGSALGSKAPMLTRGKAREISHPDWTCRDRTLTQITGWKPQVEIEAGFAETVSWYRDAGWL